MRWSLIFMFSFSAFMLSGQSIELMVLGTAQDAGHPQAGCMKSCCVEAHKNPNAKHWVSCLAIIDHHNERKWILDATPDIIDQLHFLHQHTKFQSQDVNGILLTHAHIGHYTGLMHLGHEAMGAKDIPVYAMPRMAAFLQNNGPWSQLVNYRNIVIHPLQDSITVALTDHLRIMPFTVPHRDEFSETVGFVVETDQRKVLFIPDIDKWEAWDNDLKEVIKEVDYAFIDATFFGDGEINRPMNEVPHPFVVETMELLETLPKAERRKVNFIHLNHTNPLLNIESKAFQQVIANGFHVAQVGDSYSLSK